MYVFSQGAAGGDFTQKVTFELKLEILPKFMEFYENSIFGGPWPGGGWCLQQIRRTRVVKK